MEILEQIRLNQGSLELDSEELNAVRTSIAELNGKLINAKAQCKEITQRGIAAQNALQKRECEISFGSVKMRALRDSCLKLELEIKTNREKLSQAQCELSSTAEQHLLSSVEFAQKWNYLPSGITFRKNLRDVMLEEITVMKQGLEEELAEFLKNEKLYEELLLEKRKLEREADVNGIEQLKREQNLTAMIRIAKVGAEDLEMKHQENGQYFSTEKGRLTRRISEARSSVTRLKSQNTSLNLMFQQQSVTRQTFGYAISTPMNSTPFRGHENFTLGHPVMVSLQGPQEKYRRIEMQDNSIGTGSNGSASSMILVPLQPRKFSFKKKSTTDSSNNGQ